MKCPKCHYLGFETGDRCKNCGYDFSLLSVTESELADYEIHPAAVDDVPVRVVEHISPDDDPWLGTEGEPIAAHVDLVLPVRPAVPPIDEPRIELATGFVQTEVAPESVPDLPLTPPPAPSDALPPPHTFAETPIDIAPPARPIAPYLSAMSVRPPNPPNERVLPLFKRGQEGDEPLVKVPAAPRPPLAVRRTPDPPRLRGVLRPFDRAVPPPGLQFSEENALDRTAPPEQRAAPARPAAAPAASVVESTLPLESITPVRRIAAALIDSVILFGIDAAVVYFTVRMAGLSMDEWTTLPVAPMATFLGLLTVSYLCAFTAVGGQTIGKMALGTCVVDEDGNPVDATRALRRTSAAMVSFLFFGLGFVPALFSDYRALHDRLSGTRVVRLRSV